MLFTFKLGPMSAVAAVALFLLPIVPLTAVAQSPEDDPLVCFCLLNPDEAYFLWGCTDATPKNGVTKQAFCWNRQTETSSETPVKIVPPWVRVEEGQGSCEPCRPVRAGPREIPRE